MPDCPWDPTESPSLASMRATDSVRQQYEVQPLRVPLVRFRLLVARITADVPLSSVG